ncbi:MAG: NAD(P)-dependent dehydrogenase (short-subunit alcohol dehydrogenase family) [Candidatus Latescibacterota bacterium]|jgi:NAD(P)-dependent dehydrogenase (short-subunit alcohol dehydrogenase family)
MASNKGKIAVVTGGASGIGLATVEVLAQSGAAVIALDRDEEKLAELQGRDGIWPLRGDVTQAATWGRVVELADKELGGAPTLFVSNAAVVVVGSILELSDEDWQQVLGVNLMGSVFGARALLPGMIKAGGGSMVLMGSIDAFMAEQGLAAYCASKGAILQLSKVLAVDHARDGVRVNCVCPGVTDTPLFRYHLSKADDPASVLAMRTERNPLGRLLAPEDVAQTVAFLLSDEAAGITGAMVPVDAGLSTSFEYRSAEAWGDMA